MMTVDGAGDGWSVPEQSGSFCYSQALPPSYCLIRRSPVTWRVTRFGRSWRSRRPKDCIFYLESTADPANRFPDGVERRLPRGDIAVEDKDKFRIEGLVWVREKSASGQIRLGVPREYLEWLPHAEEVFANERGGYLWTTVHWSGTIEQPQQDLSPRIIDALQESPGAFLGLIFRQVSEWLKDAFGGE